MAIQAASKKWLRLKGRNQLPKVIEGIKFNDGVEVNDHSLADLREAIGYVPQDPFLFSETLRENIALGAGGESPSGAADGAVDWSRRFFPLGLAQND